MVASSNSVFGIKDRQRAVFNSLLRSRNNPDKREWKVLVCDSLAHQSLSCLFQPSNLRRHGVTLNTIIDKPRGTVPDVPVIYFVAPTPENIAWLLKDLAGDDALYTSAEICFTSYVSRPMLMALAAQLPVPAPVTRVTDLYADFLSFDQDLFSLNITKSYATIKSIKDNATGDQLVNCIVNRLFSALLTLGVIPIIRSQTGGAAEAVSRQLDKVLRENLELFQKAAFSNRALSFRRPLLLMLDRDFDFNAILHHTWTYQALIHDCLECSLNRVNVPLSSAAASEKKKSTYLLDKEVDSFWAQNALLPFPTVASAIDSALKEYRTEVDEINRNATASSTSTNSTVETSKLARTIAALPQLSKRKETIDVHTNIATALLNHINKRALDAYFELESKLMNNANRPTTSLSCEEYKAAMMELLKGNRENDDGEKRGAGTGRDRLRLFLIFYGIFGAEMTEKALAECRGILHNAGADTSVIEYVGKMRGFRHDLVTEEPPSSQGTLNTAKLKGMMANVMNRGYRSFANVAQNAKKLVMEEEKSFAVARIAELFMNEQARTRHQASADTVLDGYLMFDPKVLETPSHDVHHASLEENNVVDSNGEKVLSSKQRMQRLVFSDAIIFTVGGGNYVEYDNCVEMAKSISTARSKKNILYGTTEMMTSEDFLQQLSAVARIESRGSGV